MNGKQVGIARLFFLASGIAANAWGWVPFIDVLSPPSAVPGSGPLSLTISGANFLPGAFVDFNGVKLTPDSLTAGQLHVTVPAANLATAHTASVTVVNPDTAPLNGASNVAFFPIAKARSSFSTVSETLPAPAVGYPESVLAGDFNGDGKQDLVVFTDCYDIATCTLANITTYLGNGAGGFTVAATTTLAASEFSQLTAVTGDFNGDGKLDLAVSNPEGSAVTILLGDGTGAFITGAALAIDDPVSLAAGDFNGDGKLDLAVIAHPGTAPPYTVVIFLGDGTGNFNSTLSFTSESLYYGGIITVADVNGDGKPDLAIISPLAGLTILLGNGVGGFTVYQPVVGVGFGLYFTPAAISVGDFNGDGKPDLALVGFSSEPYEVRTIFLLLNDGTGNFPNASGVLSINGTNWLAVGDFNGDGNLDLAYGSSTVSVLLGDGSGGFTAASTSVTTYAAISQVAVGDFNGDGQLDLGVASQAGSTYPTDESPLLSVLLQTDPPDPPADPPTDVTALVKITSTGLVYSRVTQSYHGTITVTNTSSLTVAAPLELTFGNLTSGVSLVSPSGSYQGSPYLTLPGGLAPGQSAGLSVQLSDPGNVSIAFTNQVYSGSPD